MTDAHCHPWDLSKYLKDAEKERRETKTTVAGSSWNRDQFIYNEGLAKKADAEGAPSVFCCFALHPQLSEDVSFSPAAGTELLWSLAAEGRLDAVGETGFDLYSNEYKAGENIQDEMFQSHLDAASHYMLPMVLHVRKAMHKIFPFTPKFKKLPAIVFHSWSGTMGEAEALLRKGVNAYFSFGTVILKNHKEAIACAASLPAERLLFETDAPYQPLRGGSFSSWQDLAVICEGIAALRMEAGSPCSTSEELQKQTDANFLAVFSRLGNPN